MKLPVKPQLLKPLTLAGGGLGCLLRFTLYTTGMDEKGLLISGHWAGTALWILTVLLAVALFVLTRPMEGPGDYRDAHPASFLGGVSAIVLAAAIGIATKNELSAGSVLHIFSGLLGFGAAASLVYIGICRMTGGKPPFLCHGLVSGCFAVRMVSQYQLWSSDPQIQDYVFYLSAYAALMLTAYQQAAFDADMGSHRDLWGLSLGAVYLCCAALPEAADIWLLVAGAFWAFSNLTSLSPRPRRQRPALKLEDEPQEEV